MYGVEEACVIFLAHALGVWSKALGFIVVEVMPLYSSGHFI